MTKQEFEYFVYTALCNHVEDKNQEENIDVRSKEFQEGLIVTIDNEEFQVTIIKK